MDERSGPVIAAFLQTEDGHRMAVEHGAVVGRTAACDLTIDLPAVSRRHARFEQRAGVWWLQDLGSKNGTFVNGRPLDGGEVTLGDGDDIVFAGAMTAVFRDPEATPVASRVGRLTGIWIDPASAAVWVDATRLEPPLSARQLDLLRLLDRNRGDIVPRHDVVATVWADVAADGVSDEAVAALLKRLRARLREGPTGVDYIDVVKGRGVRLLDGS